jgi:hypothetical protein
MEMKLYPSLSVFVQYVNTQDHVVPLLPLQERNVCVQFQEEYCTLYISSKGLHISSEAHGTDKLVLKQEDDLQQLITGAVRLQMLIRRRGAEYKGTYRTLLLLESLFHICKPLELGA